MNIRKVTLADAQQLLDIYAPYITDTAITYEYDVPSVEEFAQRITSITSKFPYFVAEEDGVILGYVYASTFKGRRAYDCSVETSIYVKKGCHKKGIGRALYARLEEALKPLGITNLYACIAYAPVEDEYLTNDSVLFHEKMGYKLCGTFNNCAVKFNRSYSMVWMEKFI